jgi:hypothetical protein
MMRDADFGVVRLRAYGTYDFRVVDPKQFLKEVAGHRRSFPAGRVRRHDALAARQRVLRCAGPGQDPALDVASRYAELGAALLPLINPAIGAKYGLEMTTFIVENVSVPPEVEQAIDKRSSMAAVGNLNDYVKVPDGAGAGKRRRRPRRHGGRNGGRHGNGAADAAANRRAHGADDTGVAVRRRAAGAPTLYTPAQVAQMLGRERSRRRRKPRLGRSEGQEDRHAMARHPRRIDNFLRT